jgi:hypothetical protein
MACWHLPLHPVPDVSAAADYAIAATQPAPGRGRAGAVAAGERRKRRQCTAQPGPGSANGRAVQRVSRRAAGGSRGASGDGKGKPEAGLLVALSQGRLADGDFPALYRSRVDEGACLDWRGGRVGASTSHELLDVHLGHRLCRFAPRPVAAGEQGDADCQG